MIIDIQKYGGGGAAVVVEVHVNARRHSGVYVMLAHKSNFPPETMGLRILHNKTNYTKRSQILHTRSFTRHSATIEHNLNVAQIASVIKML